MEPEILSLANYSSKISGNVEILQLLRFCLIKQIDCSLQLIKTFLLASNNSILCLIEFSDPENCN